MINRIQWVGFFYDENTNNGIVDTDGGSDIVFVNKGTAPVFVDSTILNTGDSFTDTCFGKEINETKYRISFGAGTRALYYRIKRYL